MAEECLKLAIAVDNRHALAYNNLGVIQMRNGNVTTARTYFHAAATIANYIHEPHFNSAHLAYKVLKQYIHINIIHCEQYYHFIAYS